MFKSRLGFFEINFDTNDKGSLGNLLNKGRLSSYSANLCAAGTSNGYSNGGVLSATTSSSAGQSQFSAAAASDDACLTGEILPAPNLKVYSVADLKTATRNFKSDMVLGIGGFGTVYKGWVDEKTLAPSKLGAGMLVAIKKLNPESLQGFEEWQVMYCFVL